MTAKQIDRLQFHSSRKKLENSPCTLRLQFQWRSWFLVRLLFECLSISWSLHWTESNVSMQTKKASLVVKKSSFTQCKSFSNSEVWTIHSRKGLETIVLHDIQGLWMPVDMILVLHNRIDMAQKVLHSLSIDSFALQDLAVDAGVDFIGELLGGAPPPVRPSRHDLASSLLGTL